MLNDGNSRSCSQTSTTLSTRLDPEDLRAVIGAYHRCVAETVDRFDGFVAKYMGDGVLVYFGYPKAHEEDAERALHCALAIASLVPQLAVKRTLDLTRRRGSHGYPQGHRSGHVQPRRALMSAATVL